MKLGSAKIGEFGVNIVAVPKGSHIVSAKRLVYDYTVYFLFDEQQKNTEQVEVIILNEGDTVSEGFRYLSLCVNPNHGIVSHVLYKWPQQNLLDEISLFCGMNKQLVKGLLIKALYNIPVEDGAWGQAHATLKE